MPNCHTEIIFGPPGTGKTTTLIDLVSEALKTGVQPEEIGYITFTKSATEEVKSRVVTGLDISVKRLKFFRTLHSLCFYMQGLSKASMIAPENFVEFSDLIGLDFVVNSNTNDDEEMYLEQEENKYLFLENLSRTKCMSLEDVFEENRDEFLSLDQLNVFSKAYREYKENKLVMDFTDILSKQLAYHNYPSFKILFLDEAQDFSKLQWKILHEIIKRADKVYIAGDDDQAIHEWAGADVDSFLSLEGNRTVLAHSYRMPKAVKEFSATITDKIERRQEKFFSANDNEGEVCFEFDFSRLEEDLSSGEWLILLRNNSQIKKIEKLCFRLGYFYSIKDWDHTKTKKFREIAAYKGERPWYEMIEMNPYVKEYLLSCRRNGEKLLQPPRIKIGTMHWAKGMEADNVVVFSDVGKRAYKNLQEDPDQEHRVFYTAVTRAKRRLFIIANKTNSFYNF